MVSVSVIWGCNSWWRWSKSSCFDHLVFLWSGGCGFSPLGVSLVGGLSREWPQHGGIVAFGWSWQKSSETQPEWLGQFDGKVYSKGWEIQSRIFVFSLCLSDWHVYDSWESIFWCYYFLIENPWNDQIQNPSPFRSFLGETLLYHFPGWYSHHDYNGCPLFWCDVCCSQVAKSKNLSTCSGESQGHAINNG